MFGEAPLGQLSNQPRNTCGIQDLETSICLWSRTPSWAFWERRAGLQFRAEFFNLLNRANFGFLNAGAGRFRG